MTERSEVGPPALKADATHAEQPLKSVIAAADSLQTMAVRVEATVGDRIEVARKKAQSMTEKAPDPYELAIAEYNAAYTSMSDAGLELLIVRQRTTDLVDLIERLVNSIANTPKSFDADVKRIETRKAEFLESEAFIRRDLAAAKQSAAGAGAGVAAAAAVASLAPSAAVWVATTFGTASTGTAISALSGAAATNATLAWLGGGAIAVGGGGTAAGTALLALAGPVGWTVAGATLLTSVVLFTKRKFETREAKEEALTALKENTASVRQIGAQVQDLLERSVSMREQLLAQYHAAVDHHGSDFNALEERERSLLGALVNNTLACTAQLESIIEGAEAVDV